MNYIKRCPEGIEVQQSEIKIERKGIVQYLNELCLLEGTNYLGKREGAKFILHTNSKLPIHVSDDVLLIPTSSVRCFDVVYFNLFTLLSYVKTKQGTMMIFTDGNKITVKTSLTIIKKQIQKGNVLVEYFIKRKCLHAGLINRFYNENLV